MPYKPIDENKIPQTEQYIGWIRGYTRLPHRRTGSEEGRQAAEYTKDVFERLGLHDVRIEETDAFICENDQYRLTVEGQSIDCFPVNGTYRLGEFGTFAVGDAGVDAEFIYLGCGDETDFEGVDVKGKIVVCDCPWKDSYEEDYVAWCKGSVFRYDPHQDERVVSGRKKDSYSPLKWPYNYCRALQAGAAGFVGILNDYIADGIFYNEDYTEEINGFGVEKATLPALWVGSNEEKRLKEIVAKGGNEDKTSARGDFILQKTYRPCRAKNVIGILPGKSDETILVHSHLDAVFTGAVQDASGMSEVIGLASYFSQIPEEERGCTLMFAGFDGHYTDYEGHQDFVRRRKADGTNIILDAVIEHIAKEVVLDENNEPVETGEAELRMMYVSEKGDLWDITKEALIRGDITRTIMMAARINDSGNNGNYQFEQDEVISDAFYNAQAGVPVVSILSPPIYLFHPMDTIEMVDADSLRPIGKMYAEIISRVMGTGKSLKEN